MSRTDISALTPLAEDIPPGPQRIRGVAGSGKTRLLCQKAAWMHKEHPDWDIAYVFFTQALYDEIHENIARTLAGLGVTWNEKKLRILHTWGGPGREGLYGVICKKHHVPAGTVEDTKYLYAKGLADLTRTLLKTVHLTPLFDAILIDEGQDLAFQEKNLKYKKKQAIYWMAYRALKIPDKKKPHLRRLIWAYDEYQNISSLSMPTGKEIFGKKKPYRKILRGEYNGGIPKNILMKECYRTPGPALLAAHAIGMGMFRSEGLLEGPTSREEWENLGYSVEGTFEPGTQITLTRPVEHSKNLITGYTKYPLISFQQFTFEAEEFQNLAEKIHELIFTHHINPYKRILILYLCDKAKGERIGQYLNMKGIDYYYPANPDMNTPPIGDYTQKLPRTFWHENCVTIAHMNQGKGNEADFVFVVSVDTVAKNEQETTERNALFTAMTRTKAFLSLSGIGNYPLYAEIMSVLLSIGNNPHEISFTYRGAPRIPINAGE